MSIRSVDLEDSGAAAAAGWERLLLRTLRGLRYGSVEVVVHDGRVVQMETREKVRFADRERGEGST